MQGRVGECLYQAEGRFGRGDVNGEEKLEAFKGQRVSFSWLFIPRQRYPPTTGRYLEITYVNLITRNFPNWAGEGLGSKQASTTKELWYLPPKTAEDGEQPISTFKYQKTFPESYTQYRHDSPPKCFKNLVVLECGLYTISQTTRPSIFPHKLPT